jgi:DNA-binding CsgD family transcriptional regulator
MDARLKHLTREELEILNLACDGKSSKEIADVLGMAYGAVQENAQTINRKLGIENLPEADRKREMHRLCAAVADLLTDDPERLPSGRDRFGGPPRPGLRRDHRHPVPAPALVEVSQGRDHFHHGGGYSRSRSGLPRTARRSADADGRASFPNTRPHQYGWPSGQRYPRNPASAWSGSNICNRQGYSTSRRLFRPTPGRAVGEVPNPMQPELLAELLEPQYEAGGSPLRSVQGVERLQSRGLQGIHRCGRRHLPGFDHY